VYDVEGRACADANDQDITSVFYDVLDFIEVLTVPCISNVGSCCWSRPQLIVEGHCQHEHPVGNCRPGALLLHMLYRNGDCWRSDAA